MSQDEKIYHESLVHPAMFAHPNPVHVAVIGGGEGASVRELLRHNTVETVTIIEIDSLLVEIAREHLSFMSDCSDILGVAPNCFDDERVNLIIEDAKTWFVDRFGSQPTKQDSVLNKFDVVIFDTLEPNDNSELVNNEAFLSAVRNSMSDDGVAAMYTGETFDLSDPSLDISDLAIDRFIRSMEKEAGAIFVYEEGFTNSEIPSNYLAICKNASCRDRWFEEPMVIDYQISQRIKEKKSKETKLLNFDGATQHLYQIAPRVWEEMYCRREPQPFECDYRSIDFTKEMFHLPVDVDGNDEESSFTLTTNKDNTGKQVTEIYATEDIPKGSYIMPYSSAASFSIAENTHNLVKSNVERSENRGDDASVIKNFLKYIDNHGHESIREGRSLRYVEIGGTSLIRKSSNLDEVNIGRWMPTHPSGHQPVYSPVYERHVVSFDTFLVATKDIKKGEEIVKPENVWSA
jgi:spermidine synthase